MNEFRKHLRRDGHNVAGREQPGRATVAALRLNCPALVNLRRALGAVGEHPPEAS